MSGMDLESRHEIYYDMLMRMEQKVDGLCGDVTVLKTHLLGNDGPGILSKVNNLDSRVDVLENHRSYQRGLFSIGLFLAGVSALISVIVGATKIFGLIS